jgi:hypothetical protein
MPNNLGTVVHTVFGAALSVLLTSSPLMKACKWFQVGRPLVAFSLIVLVGVLAEISSDRIANGVSGFRWWAGIVAVIASMFVTFAEPSLEFSGRISFLPDVSVSQITALMLLWAVSLNLLALIGYRLTRGNDR